MKRNARLSSLVAVWLVAGMVALAGMGCKTLFGNPKMPTAASIPSDQKTAFVVNDNTLQVLTEAIRQKEHVLATSLEQLPDGGAGVYNKWEVHERLMDGTIALGPNGQPLLAKGECVVKVNSLQNFKNMTGLSEAELYLAAHPSFGKDVPLEVQKVTTAPLDGLVLKIKGLEQATLEAQQAAIVAAHAAERTSIIKGWSEIIEKQWVGRTAILEMTGTNFVKVIDATGKVITGYLTSVTPLNPAGTELQAVIQQIGGQLLTTVLKKEPEVSPTAADPKTPATP